MPQPLLLHDLHQQSATCEPFGDWLVPWRFGPLDAEYQRLRTGVGLIDYSVLAAIELRGADRVSFLHNLLSNDIASLAPGTGCPAALLTPSAKLTAELLVLADPDALWLLCEAGRVATVVQTLDRHLFSERVSMTNHERRVAVLALQGPRTIELLIQMLGTVVSIPHAGDHVAATLKGVGLRVIRHSLTGEVGALCLCPAEQLRSVWDLLAKREPEFGLGLVGWEALNVARVEAGIPWFGIDMDDTNLLPETGLETTTVCNSKGCYMGQEIIARMQTYGTANKKLVGLLTEGTPVPVRGDAIVRDDETLGRVTSACFSPALKRPIAMGYVKRGAYDPGTAVTILRGDQPLAASVTTRPFVDWK